MMSSEILMVAIAKTAQTAVTLLVISVSYKESNNRLFFLVQNQWYSSSTTSCSQPQWQNGATLCWRCTVCPVWPPLTSSPGSYEGPLSSSVPQLCELKRLQTGAAECASVHRNSWGRSSALTGDDITWQVFIWLISRSLASSQAPDTCFTSEALVEQRRAGQDKGWAVAAGAKFSHAAVQCQDHVRRMWGKRAQAGEAVSLIITRWQVRSFASVHR